MTNVTVQLSPETESRLREQASQRGESLETYLRHLAEKEAEADSKPCDMLAQMECFLGYFQRVSIDDLEIIRAYSVIDAHAQRIGRQLGKNDAWIAATASITGARLLTTDKDYDWLDPLFLSRDWIDSNA